MDRRIGELNIKARLTEGDVRLIRALHAEGLSRRVIARKFEVGKTAIENIVTKTTWKHVQ